MKYLYHIVAFLLVLTACGTAPLPQNIDSMEPNVIIQKAQEYADKNDWKMAERLYIYCLEKFADDTYYATVCKYEVAFCAYKLKQYDRARTILNELLAEYNSPKKYELPPHIFKLAKILLESIDKQTGKAS